MHRLFILILICADIISCQALSLQRRASGDGENNVPAPTHCSGSTCRRRGRDGRYVSAARPLTHVDDPRLIAPTGRPAIFITESRHGRSWHFEARNGPRDEINLARWFTGSLQDRPGVLSRYDNTHEINVPELGLVGFTRMFWHFSDRTVQDEQRFHVRVVTHPSYLLMSYLQNTGLYIDSLTISAIPIRERYMHRGMGEIEFWPEGTPARDGHQPQHAEYQIGSSGIAAQIDSSYVLTTSILAVERLRVMVRVRWIVRWSITRHQPDWWIPFLESQEHLDPAHIHRFNT